MDDFTEIRKTMVEEQIRIRGITDDNVLRAMAKVPRHLFVPDESKERAYADEALPFYLGQTISQPYIVAYMSEYLKLSSQDTVLEVGTGSGYQTAVLAELAAKIYTIEILSDLQKKAKTVLQNSGYKNLFYKTGDGYSGWREHAPYNKIIVTAAPAQIPQVLIDQLADPGKLIVPIGRMFQNLMLIEKNNGKITEKRLIGVRFVPMVHNGK